MRRRTYSGAELVANISASPFRLGTEQSRRELIATRAADHQCTIAYANAFGCNDGLIFDGGGYLNPNGKGVMGAPRFSAGFPAGTHDLRPPPPPPPPDPPPLPGPHAYCA